MNPVLPLPVLVPLLLVVTIAAAWLSWKSTAKAAPGLRRWLLGLRSAALILLALFLLNPGRWEARSDQQAKSWICLIDDSRSMSVTNGETSRSASAATLAGKIRERAADEELPIRTFTFSTDASEMEVDAPLTALDAEQEGSDLTSAADALLASLSARGESPAGVIVLSDGRQTGVPRESDFALRARALRVPFHAVTIGGAYQAPDLELQLPRKTLTAFPGQSVQIPVVINSRGLKSGKSLLTLLNDAGEEILREEVEPAADARTVHTFSIAAPEASTTWQVRLATHPDESRSTNNQSEVFIRILKNKARVFIAEGAPYWDSKFLAQLLRRQKQMEVHSVHRLSDNRWFRIDSDDAGSEGESESAESIFPDTREKLAAYDLIIFGKNAEHFLTDERLALLRGFVKDQGGAVLFARSKPYSGVLPGLEPLEPVSWATGLTGEFQMLPSADGQAAGLFGQALPAPDSPVWNSLPKLKDGHRVDIVKPFTRVLAHGKVGAADVQGRFPLLMVRRYGQGVSGLVNADGLWKWDFFPEARELGNMYHEFWIQMIHWMLAYSEFLPGHDYSLNLSASTVPPTTPISVRMAWRGEGTPPPPTLRVTSPELSEPLDLTPSVTPTSDGRLKWSAGFAPEKPGRYQFSLIVEGSDAQKALPEATLVVQPPPAEMDELSADSGFLERFTAATGGELVSEADFDSFLAKTLITQPPSALDAGVEWLPFWLRWFVPFILLILLGTEWWLRRRQGLL